MSLHVELRERFRDALSCISKLGPTEALLDALCATVPQPSREALERVLDGYSINRAVVGFQPTDPPANVSLSLIENLLAWARGDSESPRWCPHIQRMQSTSDTGCWMLCSPPSADRVGGVLRPVLACDQFCPICGARRPAEAT